MTNGQCPHSSISRVFYLVILIVLITSFARELAVTGLKFYTSLVRDPRAEQLLGDYYRMHAKASTQLSYQFYNYARADYETSLPSITPERQAAAYYHIGQLYECGKGVLQDLTKAQHWYQIALASAKQHTLSEHCGDEILHDITHHLDRVEDALQQGKTNLVCPIETHLFSLKE